MFSIEEKQKIASAIETILLELKHPEMPTEQPMFSLHVDGKESWSWADIKPNWIFDENNKPKINSWNESVRNIIKTTERNSIKVEKCFVTFLSPGTFLQETTTKPIDSWDVEIAKKMADTIIERHAARPYGFFFTKRSRGAEDLDSKQVDKSGIFYIKDRCQIMTLDQIKERKDSSDAMLIENMENNNLKQVVQTITGYKCIQPFSEHDMLV